MIPDAAQDRSRTPEHERWFDAAHGRDIAAGASGAAGSETADSVAGWIASIGVAGVALCLISELMQRLESLEGVYGLGVLNLLFAISLTTFLLAVLILAGDRAAAVIASRTGRRPGWRCARALLAACALIATAETLLWRPRERTGLTGSVELLGTVLVALAAVALAVRTARVRHRRA